MYQPTISFESKTKDCPKVFIENTEINYKGIEYLCGL